MPPEFARQPRGLLEVKRWKATEFRQFLLYSGPIVLKGVLSKSYYQHFLSLSASITILCYPTQENRPTELLNYVEELLIWFVREAKVLYGIAFLSYNVHNLIHLVSDVRYHGCSLDGISAFPFENYLQILKKYVRNSDKPLVQIVKRIGELEKAGTSHSQNHVLTKVKVDRRNCFSYLKSRAIAEVCHVSSDDLYLCSIMLPHKLDSFFKEPFDSKMIKIYYCRRNISRENRNIKRSELLHKMIYLETDNEFVLVPLVTEVKWKDNIA